MKSVNFWLLTNLIKHVDGAFRGASGLDVKPGCSLDSAGLGSW